MYLLESLYSFMELLLAELNEKGGGFYHTLFNFLNYNAMIIQAGLEDIAQREAVNINLSGK